MNQQPSQLDLHYTTDFIPEGECASTN